MHIDYDLFIVFTIWSRFLPQTMDNFKLLEMFLPLTIGLELAYPQDDDQK